MTRVVFVRNCTTRVCMFRSTRVMRFVFLLLILCGISARAREPEEQVEKHWVDNRWNQTVLGPFQACTMTFPNGTITKALAINAGGDVAVCYDTVSGNLRAAWKGGFLHFDEARYGLINKPRFAGTVQFLAPHGSRWNEPVKYRGLEVRGDHVIVRWRVGETDVDESPSAASVADLPVVMRTWEVGPSSRALRLEILDATNRGSIVETIEGVSIARVDSGENTTAAIALGAATVCPNDQNVAVDFSPADVPRLAAIWIWTGPKARLSEFAKFVQSVGKSEKPSSVKTLAMPPPMPNNHWTPLTTVGELGKGSQPWLIDTLTAPYDNPWKALLFFSGIDFLPSGEVVACTIHGDVWLISGIDEKLGHLTWRRFATGLFQPLGLRVVDGRIHLLGRDRITVLRDHDANGEADEYENFSDLIQTSAGGHDYVTSLETDPSGNFYYVDPRGVHRISSDGKNHETIATGWRNPNGMSVGPDGTITVAPQEGNWTPASRIDVVRAGGYYGYGGPRVAPERPLGYDLPLCWIPRAIDNSTGSQVWVASDRWGIPRGELLNLSFGRCSVQWVLRETVQGQPQGGVVALPGRFLSGVMRGVFSPIDGQLYVAGAQGWQTAATRDGCLQRMRYTGRKISLPTRLATRTNGLQITFAVPLAEAPAEDVGSYHIEQWNYQYAQQYGSKEFSVAQPGVPGRDPVEIRSARLLEDRCTVFLEIPQIRPVMQMRVEWNLNAADGAVLRGELFNTIHHLGK